MEVLLILLATLQATSSLSSDREVSGWEGGSVSVQCRYDLKYGDHVKYWCKGKSWELCEAVKWSDDPKRDEDKVSIRDDQTRGVFTVTMRRLEKTDKGWYWCAIKLNGNQTDEHAYVYLKVAQGNKNIVCLTAVFAGTSRLSVASYTITGLEGGSVSILCHYNDCCWDHVKYWCTGKEWDSCKTVKRTDSPQNASDKTSITENKTQGVFSVTMRRLEKGDAGWYWCAIEREGLDDRISLFLRVSDRLSSTVTSPSTMPSKTTVQQWKNNQTARNTSRYGTLPTQ
ncbi:CMRF35-like molecule 3 [Polyodon spathula]|uniref:CMRF35-like molecule 3 n=1 Tax=Polyodon spathula TaxID=7913 RepID=UPI001B7E00B3|nr:CMRF35-like molecule 3 [Polyodon spathula]